jgi:hypothetical protein
MRELSTFTNLVKAIDDKWGHTYEPFAHEVFADLTSSNLRSADYSKVSFKKTEFTRNLYIPSLRNLNN